MLTSNVIKWCTLNCLNKYGKLYTFKQLNANKTKRTFNVNVNGSS